MKYSLTAFSSIFDNKTHRQLHHDSWESFEAMLYKMSQTSGYKLKKGERKAPAGLKASPLISPAVFPPGTTRANDNVIEWAGWAALDIDDHKFEGDLEKELYAKYGTYYYVCYSTSSSTIDHPKFRLVFPLKNGVRKELIKQFWFALNKEFDGLGDGQTKDLSRMYYVPALYPSSNNFIFTNSTGSFIEPSSLISKHPLQVVQSSITTFMDRLPPELQKKVLNHREELLKDNATKLVASPNPAKSSILFESDVYNPIQAIELFDMSGRSVRVARNINANQYQLDRGTLPNGMYIAKVRFEGGILSKKIVFEDK